MAYLPLLTPILSNLSEAFPEDMDERLSVMRCCFDVTEFPEEHMIPILHTSKTAKLLFDYVILWDMYHGSISISFSIMEYHDNVSSNNNYL